MVERIRSKRAGQKPVRRGLGGRGRWVGWGGGGTGRIVGGDVEMETQVRRKTEQGSA